VEDKQRRDNGRETDGIEIEGGKETERKIVKAT
jgi:hypothetical protein